MYWEGLRGVGAALFGLGARNIRLGKYIMLGGGDGCSDPTKGKA